MQVNLKVEHRDAVRCEVVKQVSVTFDTTHKIKVEVEIRAAGIEKSQLNKYISWVRGVIHDLVGDLIRGTMQAEEIKDYVEYGRVMVAKAKDYVFDDKVDVEYGRVLVAKVKAIWVNLL